MESQWVSVINQTRGTTLGRRVQRADSKGLLGRRGLSPGEGLLIYPCRGIHSFGMRFAFDAIYLDQDYVVLHMIEQMAANRRGPLFKRARAILELPSGTIAATATQVGDRLVVR